MATSDHRPSTVPSRHQRKSRSRHRRLCSCNSWSRTSSRAGAHFSPGVVLAHRHKHLEAETLSHYWVWEVTAWSKQAASRCLEKTDISSHSLQQHQSPHQEAPPRSRSVPVKRRRHSHTKTSTQRQHIALSCFAPQLLPLVQSWLLGSCAHQTVLNLKRNSTLPHTSAAPKPTKSTKWQRGIRE